MYGRIMARATSASGLIPQVSVVVGDTEGMASFLSGFSDVVVMTSQAALHQARPSVVAQVFGEDVTAAELGGAGVHCENGTAQIIAETDEQALLMARDVLSYLPVNNRAEAPRTEAEIMAGSITNNISEADKKLLDIIPDEASTAYDMREVVDSVVDDASFYEVSGAFAPNVLTGFARIEGRSVGVVANQPMANAGALDSAAAEKAARFIRTCDAFNTPVVTFVDSPGFVPSAEEEKAGLVRRATKLAYAYAEASVGKITVITRKALAQHSFSWVPRIWVRILLMVGQPLRLLSRRPPRLPKTSTAQTPPKSKRLSWKRSSWVHTRLLSAAWWTRLSLLLQPAVT